LAGCGLRGHQYPVAAALAGCAPLLITAHVWQRRQMCLMDRFGFARTAAKEQRRAFGFKTGDLVRAQGPTKDGELGSPCMGRVAMRARGVFTV